jgi:MFS family permease
MLCLGTSISVLVFGRLLQGLSAAVIWTVGPALLVDTVGRNGIGQAMGYVFLSLNIAILVGPLLGGIVYARCGYYAVFGMAFGLIGLDILLRLAVVEKKRAAKWTTSDSKDDACVLDDKDSIRSSKSSNSNSTGDPTTPLDTDDSSFMSIPYHSTLPSPLNSKPTCDCGCTSCTGILAFLSAVHATYSLKSTSSLSLRRRRFARLTSHLPPILLLLTSPRLLAALFGSLVQAVIMTSFDAVLPLYVSTTFNWSPIGSGLIFLALVIPSFLAPVVGMISDKHGPRWLAFAGFLFSAPFLILMRLVTHNSLPQIVLLCALLVLVGVSLTLVMPPLMAEITYIVEAKSSKNPDLFGDNGCYAQAYGLYFCAFAGGVLIGPLWAGFVTESKGWGMMTLSLGILGALSALPALIWTGGSMFKRLREKREKRVRFEVV